ncbi:MAG: DUF2127 domain-containing protein [Desulfuromonadales bacterium]
MVSAEGLIVEKMTSPALRKIPTLVAPRHSKGLHIVAMFEGAKGVLVLLAGFGLLALIHKDVHEIAGRLIANFHFNPASHYPRIFLDLLDSLDDNKLWAMALAALLYSSMRLAEANWPVVEEEVGRVVWCAVWRDLPSCRNLRTLNLVLLGPSYQYS